MPTIEPFAGTFEGAGTWHDAAGKSATYRIEQTVSATDGGFETAFRHDFDDGTVVEGRFSMSWIAPNLFRVDVAGTPAGNGYRFGDLCHYHMRFGDKFVEVSYHSRGGQLAVFGSSSINAEGNYIAWTEILRPRTGGGAAC